MEHAELCGQISLLYHLFCTSSLECLPSSMLKRYLPLLIQLYYNLPDKLAQKQQLAGLLLQCLHNCDQKELQTLLEKLYRSAFDSNFQQLHARLLLKPNEQLTEVSLQVAPADFPTESNICLALPQLLLNSEHHRLSYNVFIALLQLISEELLKTTEDIQNSQMSPVDLLQNEAELMDFLNSKYPYKLELLLSLNALISHSALKSQLAENAAEFIKVLLKLLQKRINHSKQINSEAADNTLLIMLTLTEEMLQNHNVHLQKSSEFLNLLKKLKSTTANYLILQRIEMLTNLLTNESSLGSSEYAAN